MADMDRIRRWVTITVLSILLLVILFPFALIGFWKYRLHAEIAGIKARGEPITPADLAGTKIPKSQNAAPAYMQTFKQISGPNAENDLDILKGLVRLDKPSEDTRLWVGVRRVLPKYRHAIDLAEDAAYRPKCRFSADWAKGIKAKFPYLAPLQKLGYILCADSLVNAKDGNMDQAVRSLDIGFRLTNALEDEPSMIAMVVRKAIIHMMSSTLRTVATLGDLTPEQAERLYEVLNSVDLVRVYPKVLTGERAVGIDLFDRSRRGESGYVRTPFLTADELIYLRMFSRQLNLTHLSCKEALNEDEDCQPKRWQKYALLSAILLPNFSHARRSRDEAVAEIAGDKVFLALLAYHRRFNSYPTDLAQLGMKVGWAIPTDPFTGKPFVYKRKGKGFLLYSIGPNLKDDGGLSEEQAERKRRSVPPPLPPRTDDYDIVWEMDH